MYDFMYIDVQEKKTNREYTLTISPEFDVNLHSKDLMVRGGDFYAIYIEELGLWSTDEQVVIDTVDAELKAFRNNLENPQQYDKITVLYMRNARTGSIDKWHKFVQKQMRDNFKPLNQKILFSNSKPKQSDRASFLLPYPLEKGDISAYETAMNTWFDEENRRKLEWCFGAVIDGAAKNIQKFAVLYGPPKSGKSSVLGLFEEMLSLDKSDPKQKYVSTWDSKGMGAGNAFSTDAFKNFPLLSIQHDGDLSRLEDNTTLNSIISHETVQVNPKYGKMYEARFNTFLMLGSNKPVRFTDIWSGMTRRTIDIRPTGNKLPRKQYDILTEQMKFEYGAIAYHCRKVYRDLGAAYYDDYVSLEMMEETNNFYNFMLHIYDDVVGPDYITESTAWKRYCEYCDFAGCYRMELKSMRNELKNYFNEYKERATINGQRVRRLYSGFKTDKFNIEEEGDGTSNIPTSVSVGDDDDVGWLDMKYTRSDFDEAFGEWPAQYEKDYGKGGQPEQAWAKCKTRLCDLDTSQTHYTKPPENSDIVMVDFDLKDENGEKSLEKNLEEARKWPRTYAELSKSGGGIHLYYFYDGDISKVSRIFKEGIEIKTFTGNSAIRRKLTLCNAEPIATLNGGLPLKGEKKKKVDWEGYKSAAQLHNHLVKQITRNLRKEVHADTTSSIHMIKKLLDDAYESGVPYNMSNVMVVDDGKEKRMPDAVRDFAGRATNQKDHCLECVARMRFFSETQETIVLPEKKPDGERPLIVLDVEIYRPDPDTDNEGLFLICWKYYGDPPDKVVAMLNPSPEQVEALFNCDIIGFNCRDYDNHMLWAASLGINNAGLYDISYRMVNLHDNTAKYGEAYDLSKWDVYEYCKAAGKRQSLKMWEIELGQSHMEMGIPWDQPAPKSRWKDIVEYCKNDVLATEAVYNATKGYRLAREFQVNLVKALHGNDIKVSTNDTANTLSKRAIFGRDRNPQKEFNYRDLAKAVTSDMYEEYKIRFGADRKFRVFNAEGLPEYRDYIPGEVLPEGWSILPFFPGYIFDQYADKGKKSFFHNDYGGEGGRTFSDPGMYVNVWDGDIASQYPTSIIEECLFGPRYTKIFAEIVQARIAVKHKDFETAGKLLGGALKPYLSEESAGDLAQGMKIIINSVYGLTKASFDNEFRDIRNKDNIVAKRGNLFMLVLKEQVEKRGFKVVHLKTDSIKIANATDDIKNFVIKFGKEYGYNFETEGEFAKFVLMNDASYVAYDKKEGWITKAKQMQEPYVRKTLFTKEPVTFDDICQTFNVHEGAIYLDLNESLIKAHVGTEEQFISLESELEKIDTAIDQQKLRRGYSSLEEMVDRANELEETIKKCHNMQFVGRVGRFCPVKPDHGGGRLYRVQDGKNYAVAGTSGFRWLEAEYIKENGLDEYIDRSYFTQLVDDAADAISKYGDLEWFINGDVSEPPPGFINEPVSKSGDLLLGNEPVSKSGKDPLVYIPVGVDEEVPFDE